MSSTALPSTSLGNVYIFRGDPSYTGISRESLEGIKHSIQKIFEHTLVYEWDLEQSPPCKWEPNALCVFPGGECSKWNTILSKDIQKQIYAWVKEGGRFLGICAGGYYGSARSQFLTKEGSWIESTRVISLFRGVCRGPHFSHNIEIVKVRWERNKTEGYVVVIKGGAFIPDGERSDKVYEVLARFLDSSESIAVVRCKGKTILSSIHWELGVKQMRSLYALFPSLIEKSPLLKESKSFRRECFREILQYCEI